MRYVMSFIIVMVLLPVAGADASEARLVREGNRLLAEEKYDEALEKYNQAVVESPDSDIIHFNRGVAEYHKEDYAAALGSFTKALLSDDPELESAAHYNIANTKYKQGRLKENTDLAAAISLFKESLSFYKRAIELNEKDRQAKFNHEFIEKKIKHLLDKLKEQQENQSQKQEKSSQEESSESEQQQKAQQAEAGGEKEEGEPEKEMSGASQEQHPDEETEETDAEKKAAAQEENEAEEQAEKEGARPEPDASEEEKTSGESQPEPAPGQEGEDKQRMSEEEARMILEGFRDSEEGERLLNQNMEKGRSFDVLKDW
jgi:Ca-activated chloride channel homolog